MRTEILMAVYNGERFLAEQIDSILQQDTDEWHLTISDDGSTDNSSAIIRQYINDFPEKISQAFPPQRFGDAKKHFFWLMKNCSAEYLLFCDQDDVWHADKVSKTVAALHTSEELWGKQTPVLVFTDQTVVDEELREIAPSMMALQQQDPDVRDYRSLLIRNVVTGCTVGINAAMAALAARCAAPERTLMHDWWLGLVAARFGKMVYRNESSMLYRQHSRNSVGAKDVRKLAYYVDRFLNQAYLKEQMRAKKQQATVFLESFEELLTADECRALRAFSKKRISLGDKLKFLKYVSSPLRKLDFLIRW